MFKEKQGLLSRQIIDEMGKCLNKNEQIILMQNRRGFSLIQQCDNCGCITSCKHCAVSLTYHQTHRKLVSHYCKFEMDAIATCTECNSENINLKGLQFLILLLFKYLLDTNRSIFLSTSNSSSLI